MRTGKLTTGFHVSARPRWRGPCRTPPTTTAATSSALAGTPGPRRRVRLAGSHHKLSCLPLRAAGAELSAGGRRRTARLRVKCSGLTARPTDPLPPLLKLHERAGRQLRVLDSLWPWWDEIIETNLGYSGIRLTNARPGNRSSAHRHTLISASRRPHDSKPLTLTLSRGNYRLTGRARSRR